MSTVRIPADRITELYLGVRAYKALTRAGIEQVTELLDLGPKGRRALPGIGPVAHEELERAVTRWQYEISSAGRLEAHLLRLEREVAALVVALAAVSTEIRATIEKAR